ncbi:hypothetical protein SAMN02745898_101877 [Streptomyces sp. 136MFCol5.1]|nr:MULTISPECIES: hypothetical protein [unclassified Streptomyces]SCY10048.1 hypothetical protein SAMN02745898_101877 [Streptomyces sp. 136MFCol5.1]SFS91945.1 hypothetical protein SAMN04487982_104458 [Streptomyces sp. ok210]
MCDYYSPHLTTKRCRRVADRADVNSVEIAYTPTDHSWFNRIEAQFTALRYLALDSTDQPGHKARGAAGFAATSADETSTPVTSAYARW